MPRRPITRVIVFVEYPFNPRDYERFGIASLEATGLPVEVWDFAPLIKPPEIVQTHTTTALPDCTYRRFSDKRTAIDAIASLPPSTFVIVTPGIHLKAMFVYRALTRGRVRYAYIANSAIPLPPPAPRTAPYVLRKLGRLTPAYLGELVVGRVPFRYFGLRPAETAIAATDYALCGNHPIDEATRIIYTHAFDYDVYLSRIQQPVSSDARLGVFLDEYLPFHQDWIRSDIRPPISPEAYYPRLRCFFDRVETETGARVVVAAHPRSQYRPEDHLFGDREVIRGRTVELVQRAGFVMLHASQSVGFAVMFNKPTISLTMDAFETATAHAGYPYNALIHIIASELGNTRLNIDREEDIDWDRVLSVDAEAYTRYRARYIKKAGSPEEPYWQIVGKYLREMEA
jgi:hypothetical protein